ELAPRRAARRQLDEGVADLRRRLDALQLEVGRVRAALSAADETWTLRTMPFSADMTIDRAWRRHPGAAAVFRRHHLPACDGCAVRFDETLAEAARAYDLDLDRLLEELAGLLR
ncbi:MAG: hypothetical protein D6798_14110, partial [Deltaproteobacteria bacterium]